MKAVSAHWSRGVQFAFDEIEFGEIVSQINVRPLGDGTVEVRARGPSDRLWEIGDIVKLVRDAGAKLGKVRPLQ